MVFKMEVAAEIQNNFIGECSSVEGYSKFISRIKSEIEWLKSESDYADNKSKKALVENLEGLVADLEEIISDETNHQGKLQKWYAKFSGIKPASS